MRWILERKRIEYLKSICIEIITIISMMMMILGGQIAWKMLGEKKSRWYEEAVAYELTHDRFIAEKTQMLFTLITGVAVLLALAGFAMNLIIRRNMLAQLKRQTEYLSIFGYRERRVSGILFFDAFIDLLASVVIVIPFTIWVWRSFLKNTELNMLLLLTISGERVEYPVFIIMYLIVAVVSFIQIILRRRKKDGKNSRSKKFSKII